jgi:hypothetical protein
MVLQGLHAGTTPVCPACAVLELGVRIRVTGGVALNITIETTTPRSLFPAQPLQIILALLICGFTVPPALHLSPYEKSYS